MLGKGKEMTKKWARPRLLNVSFGALSTRIDISDLESFSSVQAAVKAAYGPAMAQIGAPQIVLRNKDIINTRSVNVVLSSFQKLMPNLWRNSLTNGAATQDMSWKRLW